MNDCIARPTVTKEMILAAAEVVAAKIDADAESIADHYRHPMDGWELAKALDTYAYWDTTKDDMEALDEVEWLVRSALEKAEKEWFDSNDIQPPYPIGTTLSCGGRGVGVITGISSRSPATYEVKPDGQDDASSGTRRWLIKFEEAQPGSAKGGDFKSGD